MSAQIIDLRLARVRAVIGSPADVAWSAFVAAKIRAEHTGTINDMRAAVEAYDRMVVAFDALERGSGGHKP